MHYTKVLFLKIQQGKLLGSGTSLGVQMKMDGNGGKNDELCDNDDEVAKQFIIGLLLMI